MSIRRKLLVALLAALGVTGVAASGATWFEVRRQANQLFDYHLEQMALSLADQPLAASAALVPQLGLGQDYVVQVWDSGGVLAYISKNGAPLPPASSGFDDVGVDGEDWRVFTLEAPDRTIQVAAPAELRSGQATAMALRILVPILATIPVYGLIIWLIVGEGLRPLNQIARAIRRRQPASLEPLPQARLPEEVAPLVSELNALLARLREALDRQKRFTADAAHELRSPLTALQVQLDMLARARTPEENRAALEALRAGMKRAARLVEQMLTMARLEPEAQLAQPAAVALDALAAQVAGELEPLAEARRIELRLERLESVAVRGDATALHALARNLIDNAIRYAPAGGAVRLAAFAEDGSAFLVVEDDGPGIPPAERARVFDRFYRLPGSHAEGSGLGLAIARQVADAHGAEIALGDAAGGHGLRVTVRFKTA
ncbi:MAG: two-component sensor histidine kinase [Betaproteobacteria bacterium]|nr:MAG: two-component sensor histidine kinase [Betaproteobacteria bacterium]